MENYQFKKEKKGNGIWIIINEKSFLIFSKNCWVDTAKILEKEILKLENFLFPSRSKISIQLDGIGAKRMTLETEGIQGFCIDEEDNAIAYAKAFVNLLENMKKNSRKKVWVG